MAWTAAMRRKAAITRKRNAKERASRKFQKVTRGSMPLAKVPKPKVAKRKRGLLEPGVPAFNKRSGIVTSIIDGCVVVSYQGLRITIEEA